MIPPGTALLERIRVTDVTVPEGVKEGVDNWRIWGTESLHVAPVFVSPLSSCETLVCFTTDSGGTLTARAARLDANDALIGAVLDLGTGLECRGIAGGPAGEFAALLWDDATDRIFVRSFDLAGAPAGVDTELVNDDNVPDDFGIGESRFEFGAGMYGAYYHVHSDSGHEGDTLKYVDAESGAEETEWPWGCSHSMSNALRYHPTLDQFTSACVTDCYPGTDGDFETNSIGGLYMDGGESKVIDMDAGCNGSMAGELGTLALAPSAFKVVFNGHQNPATLGQNSYDEDTMNQDIGFSSIAGDLTPSPVVWLTTTADINEADSSIVPFAPMGESAETYLVGWSENDGAAYKLGRIDAAGAFVEGPIDSTAVVQWGRRDDPFRSHTNGDAIWAWFDDPGSTTLHVARALSGNACVP